MEQDEKNMHFAKTNSKRSQYSYINIRQKKNEQPKSITRDKFKHLTQ